MSESTADEVVAKPKLPPGVQVTTRQDAVNGETVTVHQVKFGSPERTMELVELTLGAQWDLMELTGGVGDANTTWHNMAYVAASVQTLNGVPAFPVLKKRDLRIRLNQLGSEGFKVAGMVLAGVRSDEQQTVEQHQAVVGN